MSARQYDGMDAVRTERTNVNEWIYVEGSVIHGMGGFARRPIPAGTRIIEYVGERISKKEAAKRCSEGNAYIFVIDEESDLDGSVDWNPARFVNHSCDPNCEAIWDDGRIFLESCREIREGEELSFDYGYDLDDWKEHPCFCKAPNCRGYIISEELYDEAIAKDRSHAEGVPPAQAV